MKLKDCWAGSVRLRDALLGYFLIGNFLVLFACAYTSKFYWKLAKNTAFEEAGYVVSYVMMSLCMLYFLSSLKVVWHCSKNANSKIIIKVTKLLIGIAAISLLFVLIRLYLEKQERWVTEITLTGEISPSLFLDFQRLVNRSWVTPSRIKITSQGGNSEAALAIGMIIRDLNIDVEVIKYCESSCANFIFPAGKHKYIGADTLILYHGSSRQKGMIEQAKVFDEAYKTGMSVSNSSLLGVLGKEGNVKPILDAQKEPLAMVRKFIGLTNIASSESVIEQLKTLEDNFYSSLKVDPKIAVYGQEGRYLETYKSYQYDGFYYSLETLDKLGVKNIHVINGSWDVAKNLFFSRVYKVDLPTN